MFSKLFVVIVVSVTVALANTNNNEVLEPLKITGNNYRNHFVRGLGPHVRQTWGEPWPEPQRRTLYGENFMVVRMALFRFKVTNFTCDMIDLALKRYYDILLGAGAESQKLKMRMTNSSERVTTGYRGHLDVLEVNLLSSCEYLPHDKMDESYKLKIDTPTRPNRGVLVANSNWGILRGLETFSQLVHHSRNHSAFRVKSTFVQDFPRFSFRSILLDSARHFLSKEILLKNLELMAMNKMNVFHWHLVDDQSFPYESKLYPELSGKGAYNPYTHVYSRQDVAEIIEYARLRGIRVIPEFDTPGHTQSWGPAVPDFLTKCYQNSTIAGRQVPVPDGTFGPIDPTQEKNYRFLKAFLGEVVDTFPDKYLHLGGDEVDFSCWKSNPDIGAFMRNENMTRYESLEEYYMQKLVEIVASFPEKKSSIVWQEVIDNGVEIEKDSVLVNVWKGWHYQDELNNVTRMGYRALLYSCWYLDMISWNIDWPGYYKCDPQNFTGSAGQKELVVGGGAALWTEFVDETNMLSRLWPRASAPAERLWSSAEVKDVEKAAPRLEEHRCRLLRRGYSVQPVNGPGFCERV